MNVTRQFLSAETETPNYSGFLLFCVIFHAYLITCVFMGSSALSSFLTEKIRGGVRKADLEEQLRAVGWSEEEIDRSYVQALLLAGVPAPEANESKGYSNRVSAVEVVVSVFSFVLLGIIVAALITLFFEIINNFFPDPLFGEKASSEAIHYAIASLVIGFPLYYFSLKLWLGNFRKEEGKRESSLTKAFTYLVLLVASIAIVIDLIFSLYSFLQGEMTWRFFLKALTILVLSGGIFGFYVMERRLVQYQKRVPRNVYFSFAWGCLGMILFGIALGFFVAGSPSTARKRAFDDRRSSDLESLSTCINDYAQRSQKFPDSLESLSQSAFLSYCGNGRDPETGKPYEYRVVTAFSLDPNALNPDAKTVWEGVYELCADFSLKSSGQMFQDGGMSSVIALPDPDTGWYSHSEGRNCKTKTVSVSVFPASR